jgi:hypothetical protein
MFIWKSTRNTAVLPKSSILIDDQCVLPSGELFLEPKHFDQWSAVRHRSQSQPLKLSGNARSLDEVRYIVAACTPTSAATSPSH